MMKKKRDHFIEILHINYRTIKDNLFPILTLVLGLVGTNQFYENMLKIGFVLLCIGIFTFSVCSWYCKVFVFDTDRIVVSEGVFRRKHQEIAINRVKAIHTSDTIFKRLLGVSNFNVELIGGGEVSFILSNKGIVDVKNAVFHDYHLESVQTPSNNFPFSQCLLVATTSAQVFLTSLMLTLTVASFVFSRVGAWFGLAETEIDQRSLIEGVRSIPETPIDVWLSVIPIMLGLIVVSIFITAIYMSFIYKGFKIVSSEQQIQITYGYFDKKDYRIPLQEIRSVRILQPILFQPFGYVQIKIDSIGMNKKTSRNLYMCPILKQSEAASFIEQHLSMFEVKEIVEKAKISVLPDYILKTVWLPTIILVVLIELNPYFLWGSLLVPFFLWVGYMRWKHAGLLFDQKYVCHSEYKWLQSINMITLKKYIQHTGISQSPITKARKVSSYHYSVYSENVNESYTCYGLNDEHRSQCSFIGGITQDGYQNFSESQCVSESSTNH